MGAGWRTSSGDGNGEQGNYNLEWNPRPLQRSKGVGGGGRGASSRAARAIFQTYPVAKRRDVDSDL